MITIYRQLGIYKKRKFKADVLRIKELIKKQIESNTLLWIKPLKDRIDLIDKVLKNEIPLEKFLDSNKQINSYISKCHKLLKKQRIHAPLKHGRK